MILKKKVLVGVSLILVLPGSVLLALNDEWLCLRLLLLGVVLCGAAVWTLPEPIGSDTAKQKR